MSKNRFTLFIVVAVLFSLLFTACGGGQATTAPPADKPAEEAPAAEEPAEAPAEEISETVRMYKGPFGPNEVELHQEIIDRFNEVYPDIEVIDVRLAYAGSADHCSAGWWNSRCDLRSGGNVSEICL